MKWKRLKITALGKWKFNIVEQNFSTWFWKTLLMVHWQKKRVQNNWNFWIDRREGKWEELGDKIIISRRRVIKYSPVTLPNVIIDMKVGLKTNILICLVQPAQVHLNFQRRWVQILSQFLCDTKNSFLIASHYSHLTVICSFCWILIFHICTVV